MEAQVNSAAKHTEWSWASLFVVVRSCAFRYIIYLVLPIQPPGAAAFHLVVLRKLALMSFHATLHRRYHLRMLSFCLSGPHKYNLCAQGSRPHSRTTMSSLRCPVLLSSWCGHHRTHPRGNRPGLGLDHEREKETKKRAAITGCGRCVS